MTFVKLTLTAALVLVFWGCAAGDDVKPERLAGGDLVCDSDNGGIRLPDGFCAVVVHDSIGPARHLAVGANGDIYVALRNTDKGGGMAILRDSTGDGKADRVEYFGDLFGTEVKLYRDFVYFGTDTEVVRYPLQAGSLIPQNTYQVIVSDFPEQGPHSSKSFAIGEDGFIYVNIGAPTNTCQDENAADHRGSDPCPVMEGHGGLWRYRSDAVGQTYLPSARFATGIRNMVGIAWNSQLDRIYAMQHGRDLLAENWPQYYTPEQGAELPSEELIQVSEKDDFGFPYCFYDHVQQKKVLAPEYGGDGRTTGRCAAIKPPVYAFPGHWAPNDLLFYTGQQFPASYRNGAFVAFHGSWNRGTDQKGFNVSFVPFDGERAAGAHQVFADGFSGRTSVPSTGDARYRPVGLAQGPDGSLYISDSVKGKIWRVVYTGAKS